MRMRIILSALFAFSIAPLANAQVIFDAFTDSGSIALNNPVNVVAARVDGPGTITMTQNSVSQNSFISLTSTDDISTLLSNAGLPALSLTDTIRLTWTVSSTAELNGNGIEFGLANGLADSFRGDGIDAHTIIRLRPDESAAFPNEPGITQDNVFVANNDSDGHFAEDLGYEVNITEDSLEDGFTLIQEISIAGVTNVVTDVAFGVAANGNNPGANNPAAGDVAVFPIVPFNNMDAGTGNFDSGPNNNGPDNAALNFLTFFNGARFHGGTQASPTGGAAAIDQHVTTAAFIEINPSTPLPMQIPEPASAVTCILALLTGCLSRRLQFCR